MQVSVHVRMSACMHVCMYACKYVCMHVWMYVYMCVCTRTHTIYIYIYIYMYTHKYKHTHTYTRIHMYMCIYIYILCLRVHMFVCVWQCMRICIHVHVYEHTSEVVCVAVFFLPMLLAAGACWTWYCRYESAVGRLIDNAFRCRIRRFAPAPPNREIVLFRSSRARAWIYPRPACCSKCSCSPSLSSAAPLYALRNEIQRET